MYVHKKYIQQAPNDFDLLEYCRRERKRGEKKVKELYRRMDTRTFIFFFLFLLVIYILREGDGIVAV